MKLVSLFILLLLLLSVPVISSEKDNNVGIEEKLDNRISLDVFFTDETGTKVLLKDLINKPVLLSFVYYKCPGICNPLLTELAHVVSRTDMKAGQDFQVITISMDERESFKDAAEKKINILGFSDKEVPLDAWSFLTGDSASIRKISDVAGFFFKRNGDDFVHSGAFIFIDKEGKICRYLYPDYSRRGGFSILPFDFKMAVIETSKGTSVKTMAKLIQYCYSYDPSGRTYVFNITRIFGAGILLAVIVFVAFVVIKPKKKI